VDDEGELLMTCGLGFAEWEFDRPRSEVKAVLNRAVVLGEVDSFRSEQQEREEQPQRLRSEALAEHQGKGRLDGHVSERIAKITNLPALDYSLNEETLIEEAERADL
jgi:hypothetical protein